MVANSGYRNDSGVLPNADTEAWQQDDVVRHWDAELPELVTDSDPEEEWNEEPYQEREQNESDSEYEDDGEEENREPADHRLRSPEDWPETLTEFGARVASILDFSSFVNGVLSDTEEEMEMLVSMKSNMYETDEHEVTNEKKMPHRETEQLYDMTGTETYNGLTEGELCCEAERCLAWAEETFGDAGWDSLKLSPSEVSEISLGKVETDTGIMGSRINCCSRRGKLERSRD